MSGRLDASLTVVLVLGSSPSVVACPCQGSSGPASSVTTPEERFGASLAETARVKQGDFSRDRTYRALGSGSRESSLDVTGIVGYRPMPPVEVSAESAVGHDSVSDPYSSSRRTGFGDTTLRARWDAIDEPMPFEQHAMAWPAVSGIVSVRMPTATGAGTASSGTTGSVGSSASSEGLGALETAGAVALRRSFGARVQLTGLFEAAYRFPDGSIGLARHLPPRLLGQLGARYAPSPTTAVGLLTDLGWEGNVSLEDRPQGGTSQQLWTVAVFGAIRATPSGVRWGTLLRWAPPVSGIDRNAAGTTAFTVSLGYAI